MELLFLACSVLSCSLGRDCEENVFYINTKALSVLSHNFCNISFKTHFPDQPEFKGCLTIIAVLLQGLLLVIIKKSFVSD